MTASLLKIDMSKAGFRDILSITDASMMYNKLSGKTFCRCMKDCALIEKIASVYYTVFTVSRDLAKHFCFAIRLPQFRSVSTFWRIKFSITAPIP